MHQRTTHTEPIPNSQSAAYGYKYAAGLARYGVSWRHTVSEPGNKPYSSSTNKALYVESSKTGYSYFVARYLESELSVWLSVDPLASKYPNESPYCYAGWNPVMITDPNGMWKDEGDGNWTAEKGDSWWSLHKESGMSWKETKAYANKYNKARGQDNWKHVGVGDQVSIPGSGEESSSSTSGATSSIANTSTATLSSTSTNTSNNASGSVSVGMPFKNTDELQSTAFGISLGTGIWSEAARDLGKTSSALTSEIQAAKVIGNIGKVARVGNIVGNTLSIGANSINVYYNPTAGNIGRLSVSVIATGANAINFLVPGLGTGISIGISVADVAWGHYLYDGLDNYFGTAP